MTTERTRELQNFQFFKPEVIPEKPFGQDVTLPTLHDFDITSAAYITPRLYLAASKKNEIYIHEGESIIARFKPYTDKLEFIEQVSMSPHGVAQYYLVTYGVDSEQPNDIKRSYIKFYEHESSLMTKDFQNIKPRKVIPVGKANAPFLGYSSFNISRDLTAFAFGCMDGSVLLYRSKNLITSDWGETTIRADKSSIIHVSFTTDNGGNTHMFCSSKNALYSFANCSNKKKLYEKGFYLCDVNDNGELVCVDDNGQTILSFSAIAKISEWNYEGDKMDLKTYGKNYVACIVNTKKESATTSLSFNIYDLRNGYLAFSKSYTAILNIILAPSNIFIVTMNQRSEKSLIRLSENEAPDKIKTFMTRGFYDYAVRFAQNQNYDPAMLAEISRCHGNHLYEMKKDYANAIEEYKKTAGYVEPSYVIMRFLDVSQIDHLINYLEHIHHKKLGDKHHTALLLNCYVKQKNIEKLKTFLEKSTLESDLFDTETAIKTCRELEYIDLALTLAMQTKHDELYLRILIEDKKDFNKAIEHLRKKLEIEEKIRYFKEYGRVLMKHEPNNTLEYMMKLVVLSTYRKQKFTPERQLTPEEKEIFDYLNLSEKDYPKLAETIFPKPDEFFHFFVVQGDEHLEAYLNFLRKCKGIQNEKAVYHKMFEYYLEKYHTYVTEHQEVLQHRKTQDENLDKWKKAIMNLLTEPDYERSNERKYDKNHILVLFKMFNFIPGIIYLCEKMPMREELLHFYCEKNDDQGVFDLCRKYGENEINLWVQALKYFSKPETKSDKLPEVLDYIEKIEVLSPLLVLNILSQNRNIKLSMFKKYYKTKFNEHKTQTTRDSNAMQANMSKIQKDREEYHKLKTSGKVFQGTKCAHCEKGIFLPSVNFMCGHSFHENCLDQKEKGHYECLKCIDEQKNVLDRKEQYDEKATDFRVFFEKMQEKKDKFEVVAEFLGRGVFKSQPTVTQIDDY